jgi:hypothetical protein
VGQPDPLAVSGSRRDRGRLLTVLVVLALAILVASVVTQVLIVFVLVPQQIRASEPVVIEQAALLDDGPIACFTLLTDPGQNGLMSSERNSAHLGAPGTVSG